MAQIVLGISVGGLATIRLPDLLGLARILPPSGLAHILIAPFFALVMCQAVLIALWGTASRSSPWRRLAGLVAGAAYLEALFPRDLRREFLGTAALTVAVTTASLLVLRALGIRLARQVEEGRPGRDEPEGLRFSIRGLMLFTAAVALLSAGARALQATPERLVLLMVVWALCFVAVGLVTLWAALGHARSLWRCLVVFALSPVLGAFFALAAHAHHAGWFYILLTMLLYPAGLLGSLLVVRSCGYRLVGRAMSSPQQQPRRRTSVR